MKTKHDTREQWLNAAIDLLRPIFKKRADVVLPKNVRISCGWTSAGQRGRRIGECWSKKSSADGQIEMFISPVLDNAIDVLQVTTHECAHAGVGLEAKHGKVFKKAAHAMGLTGKMRATVWSPEGEKEIGEVLFEKLGEYPHGALGGGLSSGPKKQSTRMVKCECKGCGYIARTTAKWIDAAGAPLCPTAGCDQNEMEVS